MHDNNFDDQTRRNRPIDLGETLRHPASEVTRPMPLQAKPPQPAQLAPSRQRWRRMRRRRVSCLGCLLRATLAGMLFAAGFTCLMASLYVIAPPPRTNILVLGLDRRPGEGIVTRSDTVILATVDPRCAYVGMLSIPRDLYVEVPGYGRQRINAAHVLGESEGPGRGPLLAAQTIEHAFGVPVHRTIRMDFEGFVAIVDAAGGVTINVARSFIDYEYPTNNYGTMVVEFRAGTQHMDGERALQYARIRHGSSDFERIARQQQVIEALVRQLLRPENWKRWPAVYQALVQHIDTDLTLLDAIMLAPTVVWVGPDGIDRRMLDRDMTTGGMTEGGASVLQPRWDRIDPLLDEMFGER